MSVKSGPSIFSSFFTTNKVNTETVGGDVSVHYRICLLETRQQ